MRAAIYVRISKDTERTGHGVERQQQDCEALAERLGWEVVGVYSDNDLSAYSGKPRPGYKRLLDDTRVGGIDAWLAYDSRRLYRVSPDLEALVNFVQEHGTAIETVASGDIDLTTADGRLKARFLGAVATNESEKMAERIQRKKLADRVSGKSSSGGYRPFGYHRCTGDPVDRCGACRDRGPDRTLVPAEAEAIREAADSVLRLGASLHSICADWEARGIATTTGKAWRSGPLKRMLTSPRIAGLASHEGEVLWDVSGDWDPVISVTTHQALLSLLNDPKRRPAARKHEGHRPYLLTGGLGVCGKCQAKLASKPVEGGKRGYSCRPGGYYQGKGCVQSVADPIEALLRDAIAARLAGKALADTLRADAESQADSRANVEALAAIGRLEDDLVKLDEDKLAGTLAYDRWLTMTTKTSERIETLRAQMVTAATGVAISDLPSDEAGIAARWDAETMEWRKRLVGLLVDRVMLHPTPVPGRNSFDPSRVEVAWRV